jgi:hypothetical protein
VSSTQLTINQAFTLCIAPQSANDTTVLDVHGCFLKISYSSIDSDHVYCG